MSKIIINNTSGLSDSDAMSFIGRHVAKGLISTGTYGKQYCHLITYGEPVELVSSCDKRKSGTYTFTLSTYGVET